jgi:HAD superfamily hydrolase (TIGR01549 family)
MTPDKIQLLLFDWDGVICDSLGVFRSLFLRIYPESAMQSEDFRAFVWQQHIQGKPILPGKLSDYAEAFAQCDLYPDMKGLLLELKEQDVRLAVVSASPFETIDLQLRRNGLADVFDEVFSSDDACYKPEPELLNRISSRFRVREEQTLFVGDQVSDIWFVQPTRYRKLFVTYGFHPEVALREVARAAGLTGEIFFDTSNALCKELRAIVNHSARSNRHVIGTPIHA